MTVVNEVYWNRGFSSPWSLSIHPDHEVFGMEYQMRMKKVGWNHCKCMWLAIVFFLIVWKTCFASTEVILEKYIKNHN